MTYLTREQVAATLHLSSRQAARELGVGKTSVNKYRKLYEDVSVVLPNAKVLILDIESKPGTAYVWGPKIDWLPNAMLIDPPSMMCFSYKWLGDPETRFIAEWHGSDETDMVYAMHSLLDQADIVVTYNGDRYDLRKINNEFWKLGMAPPSPYRSIDLFKTNKVRFDLPYKSLDYLAQSAGIGEKESTGGFRLWVGCMEGDPDSRAQMEVYNKQDVALTEQTYIRLLPWLTNVPHMGMFAFDGGLCPYCASHGVLNTGKYTNTFVQRYELYKCANCLGWSRGNKPIKDPLLTRAAR